MTLGDLQGIKVERVAEDVWFRLFARASMLLLGFVGLPLITYIGNKALGSIDKLQLEQALQTTKLEVLNATIQLNMADRYKGDDARRDFQLRDIRLKSIEDLAGKLERKIEIIEQRRPLGIK